MLQPCINVYLIQYMATWAQVSMPSNGGMVCSAVCAGLTIFRMHQNCMLYNTVGQTHIKSALFTRNLQPI